MNLTSYEYNGHDGNIYYFYSVCAQNEIDDKGEPCMVTQNLVDQGIYGFNVANWTQQLNQIISVMINIRNGSSPIQIH